MTLNPRSNSIILGEKPAKPYQNKISLAPRIVRADVPPSCRATTIPHPAVKPKKTAEWQFGLFLRA